MQLFLRYSNRPGDPPEGEKTHGLGDCAGKKEKETRVLRFDHLLVSQKRGDGGEIFVTCSRGQTKNKGSRWLRLSMVERSKRRGRGGGGNSRILTK